MHVYWRHYGSFREQMYKLVEKSLFVQKCIYVKTLTSSVCISQLLADHSSISVVPQVITHCPPLVIDAHLHSTLILIGASHQTNITISTVTAGYYCIS